MVLTILIILTLIAVWFLAAFLYRPLGKFFSKIFNDAVYEMTREENKKLED